MADKATILIPDISGFTDFTSSTELDHSSHIINELLDLIVESNEQGFTLSEIEGDAVLFYRKGEPLAKKALVDQCISIFNNFHVRLRVIERDTVCQCGACQTATNLTLKFIVHYGDVKEIRVAHFTKATGIDMIIAHRLLKNRIKSDEYILISLQCLDCIPGAKDAASLAWHSGEEQYAAIGDVPFEYAELSLLKDKIPDPPERDDFVIIRGDDNLELDIDRPMKDVYQTVINVDERIHWMLGVDKINRDPVTERIGMQHNCQFQGMTMENTCEYCEYREDGAIYVERVVMKDIALDTLDTWDVTPIGKASTRLNFNINWLNTQLPQDMIQGMLMGIKANLEALKKHCETG